MHFHQMLNARSIEMHRLIADKIRHDPQLLDKARRTVSRWRDTQTFSKKSLEFYVVEWETILSWPVEDILSFLTDPSEKAVQLRQDTPFAGVLSSQERWQFLKQWKKEHSDIYEREGIL